MGLPSNSLRDRVGNVVQDALCEGLSPRQFIAILEEMWRYELSEMQRLTSVYFEEIKKK